MTGYVDKRSVQIGERVSPGTALMAIIPLDQIWVDANFKESQLRNVRIGQPVKLISDLYGKQLSIGAVCSVSAPVPAARSPCCRRKTPRATGSRWCNGFPCASASTRDNRRTPAAHRAVHGGAIDTHERSGTALRDDPEPQDDYVTHIYQDEDKGAGALITRIIQDNTVTMLPTTV